MPDVPLAATLHGEATPFGLLDRAALRTPLLGELRERFGPLFEIAAQGTVRRELDDELPAAEVTLLKQAGFGALRVPAQYGGLGASWPEVTQLWIELAAADANLTQAFRGHFAFAEDRRWQHRRGVDQRAWFERFVAGEIAGNAWSEVGPTSMGSQRTVLAADGLGDYLLAGTKYYTTGSIFAEWADVQARRERPGHDDDLVVAIVDTREPGVVVTDDWDGFGQRGTGSGTTTFDDVPVPAAHVTELEQRFPYQTALYQLNLLATLAGIGRAALADTVREVRGRERNYSHANAARVRDDAQVLARIGEIAASVYAAEATTIRVATAMEEATRAIPGAPEDLEGAVEAVELESAAAQVVVTDLILAATSQLFDTLGASATARSKALDRHWRNARTVSSHNPRILKARVVGDHLVNGAPPPYVWSIGRTRRGTKRATSR